MQGAASPLTGVWGRAPATPLSRAAAGSEVTESLTKHYEYYEYMEKDDESANAYNIHSVLYNRYTLVSLTGGSHCHKSMVYASW